VSAPGRLPWRVARVALTLAFVLAKLVLIVAFTNRNAANFVYAGF
jgi:hypothetical protein